MTEKVNKQPWWNPILWGEKSLLQSFREALANKQVPSEILNQYNRALNEMQIISPVIKALDNEKMQEPEFLLFVKIQQQLIKSTGDYQGLNICLNLLIKALEKRNLLKTIETLEKGETTQAEKELYFYVGDIIEQLPPKQDFQQCLKEKINYILSIGNSPSLSKQAIHNIKLYNKCLEKIVIDDKGIELIYLLKKTKTSQSLVFLLEIIVILLNKYATADMINPKNLAEDIERQKTIFQEIGKFFGIAKQHNNLDGYLRIIQYLILKYKYQNLYWQFEKISELLLQWELNYFQTITIKNTHHPYDYKQPIEFIKELQGLEVYEKYKDYLPEIIQE